jgi:hypothetical protein
VLQWNNSSGTWSAVGNTALTSLTHYAGSLHGSRDATGSSACQRFDGTAWVPVRGPGIVGDVRALARSGSDMILGGTFATISGVTMNGVARWNGTSFQPLGGGLPAVSIDALVAVAGGDIVAGGQFAGAGGLPPHHIARWNGATWSSLGMGMNQPVKALCQLPDGDVVAGGMFTSAGGVACAFIARWDGTAWAPLGSGMDGPVHALAVRSDGTLFAGGSFSTAGGVACSNVAQWSGTTWSPLGAGCNGPVLGLALRPNGDLVAVGAFIDAGGVPADRCARWDGSAWATMGTGNIDPSPVTAVHALPNGDVIVSHGFHLPTNIPGGGLSRWNGTVWSGLVTLTGAQADDAVVVRCIAPTAAGGLVIGGTFSVADGVVSRNLLAIESTCMPLASPYGAGCSTAAGPLVLTADTLPWLGAVHRTTTTGIDALTLCASIIGFTQLSSPLDQLLPQGQPGCSLLTTLDIVDLRFPVGGVVHAELMVPADPALLQLTFHQQSVPLEFDLAGTLVAVRGSNGLAATIGTL